METSSKDRCNTVFDATVPTQSRPRKCSSKSVYVAFQGGFSAGLQGLAIRCHSGALMEFPNVTTPTYSVLLGGSRLSRSSPWTPPQPIFLSRSQACGVLPTSRFSLSMGPEISAISTDQTAGNNAARATIRELPEQEMDILSNQWWQFSHKAPLIVRLPPT
jgi:hypothetical protein